MAFTSVGSIAMKIISVEDGVVVRGLQPFSVGQKPATFGYLS